MQLVNCVFVTDDTVESAVFDFLNSDEYVEWVKTRVDTLCGSGYYTENEIENMFHITTGYADYPGSWEKVSLPLHTRIVLDEELFRVPVL